MVDAPLKVLPGVFWIPVALKKPAGRFAGKKKLPPFQKDVFVARPASTPGLNRIGYVGDWGTGDGAQYQMANRLVAEHDETPFASLLLGGDNVYEHGQPKRFQACINTPCEPLRKKGVLFVPARGNHENDSGHGPKQMKYWGVPKKGYYQLSLGRANVFVLSTPLLAPGYENCYAETKLVMSKPQIREMIRTLEKAQDEASEPITTEQLEHLVTHLKHQQRAYRKLARKVAKKAQAQLTWLSAALARSTANFNIVMGHYPLFSTREKTKGLADHMRNQLLPLLGKPGKGADLYLSGHDHYYERSVLPEGLTHMVSGGGAKEGKLPEEAGPHVMARAAKQHYVMLTVSPDGRRLEVEAKDGDGKVFDKVTLQSQRPALVATA